MSENTNQDRRDLRGTLGAALFIIVGLVVLWESGDIGSWGGAVFPQTLAILLIGLCILLIVRNLLGRASSEPLPPRGSAVRRTGLVLSMLVAALAMPYTGFIIAGVLSYVAIMLFAMYERWTLARKLVYPLVGVLTVFAFHFLFDTVFLVPLPDGRLFW
jgi:hypothetical protein